MSRVSIAAVFAIALTAVMAPKAKADAWNQRIVFTFSEPVEIPGQALSAGTYVFKLADIGADRDIVQVFNKNENHLYGTFLTIPDYRLKPTGKVIITFAERPAGSPPAVRAWFYPGFDYGHEFVYPKTEALQLAKANNEPVAAMPDELAADTKKPAKTMKEASVMAMKEASLKAEKPTGEETAVTDEFPMPPQSATSSQR